MARIILRPRAERDIREIWLYLAEQTDADHADRFAHQMLQKLEMAATHPYIGRQRTEIRTGLRSLVIGRYLAFYLPLDDGIDLVRVIYGGRELNQALVEE